MLTMRQLSATATIPLLYVIVLVVAAGEATGRIGEAFVVSAALALVIGLLHLARWFADRPETPWTRDVTAICVASIVLPGVLFSRTPQQSAGIAGIAVAALLLFRAGYQSFRGHANGVRSPHGFAWFLVFTTFVLVFGRMAGAAASGRPLSISWMSPAAKSSPTLSHLFDFLMALMLPCLWAAWSNSVNRAERVFCGLAAVAAAIGVILSFGRSAWLATSAAAVILVFRERAARKPAAILALAVLVLALASPGMRTRALSAVSRNDATSQQRLEQWATAGRMVAESPLVGHGLGSFGPHYRERYSPESRLYHCPHNLYLHVAAESGLPALCALGVMLSSWFAWLRRSENEAANDERRRWCSTGMAVLTAVLVFGCFDL